MNRVAQKLLLAGRAALFVLALSVAGNQAVLAQGTPELLAQSTVKALQEALTKQGFPVTADGVLNDATREAIRKYQSQHHLAVTGAPDKATLTKLGVADKKADSQTPAGNVAQAPNAETQPQAQTRMMMQGDAMNCSMMEGQMQTMMQMMKGMMGMMQTMQGQMPSKMQ